MVSSRHRCVVPRATGNRFDTGFVAKLTPRHMEMLHASGGDVRLAAMSEPCLTLQCRIVERLRKSRHSVAMHVGLYKIVAAVAACQESAPKRARARRGIIPIARPLSCLVCLAFAAANDLPALDGGSEPESGGVIEKLLENRFGTSNRLQAHSSGFS